MKKTGYSWKRLRRRTLDIFKGYGILWVSGSDPRVVNLKTGELMVIKARNLALLADQMFWWSVHIVVCCRGADDQEYIKSAFLKAEHPYKQNSMLEVHQREHSKLVASCNPQDIVSAGYIASPHGIELTDEQIDKLMTKYDAWEFHTPREAEKAREQGKVIEEVAV